MASSVLITVITQIAPTTEGDLFIETATLLLPPKTQLRPGEKKVIPFAQLFRQNIPAFDVKKPAVKKVTKKVTKKVAKKATKSK